MRSCVGVTGLWSAYHLKRIRPALNVVVVEAKHCGFGASGRNGGWVSAFYPQPEEVGACRAVGEGGYCTTVCWRNSLSMFGP